MRCAWAVVAPVGAALLLACAGRADRAACVPLITAGAQCTAAAEPMQGCAKLTSELVRVTQVPGRLASGENGTVLDPPVSELSGIAAVGGGRELVLVGDSGALFFASVGPEDVDAAVPNISFTSSVRLEVPSGMSHVDAESVAVLCAGGADTRCSLSDPDAQLVIGVERGKMDAETGGIWAFAPNGTLLSRDVISPELLVALGMDSPQQRVNEGFEALTVTEDGATLLFTTEGPVLDDAAAGLEHVRRIVAVNLASGEAQVFRYEVKLAGAGLTDMALLDAAEPRLLAVLERAYDEADDVNRVLLRYVDLRQGIKVQDPRQSRSVLTDHLHEAQAVAAGASDPLHASSADVRSQVDNYEGLVRLPCSDRLVLVSDDNESPGQKTLFATFRLHVSDVTGAPTAQSTVRPTADPTSDETLFKRGTREFSMLLVLAGGVGCLFILGGCILCCRRERRYRDANNADGDFDHAGPDRFDFGDARHGQDGFDDSIELVAA